MKFSIKKILLIISAVLVCCCIFICGFRSLRERASYNTLIHNIQEHACRYLASQNLYISDPVHPIIIPYGETPLTEEDIGYICFLFLEKKSHTVMACGYTDDEFTCSYSYLESEAIDQSVIQGLPIAIYYTRYGLYLYACGEYQMLSGIGSAREEAIALMEPYVSSETGFFEIKLIPCNG